MESCVYSMTNRRDGTSYIGVTNEFIAVLKTWMAGPRPSTS
jgi:predicted GIY-YIG superfamily endonuclease